MPAVAGRGRARRIKSGAWKLAGSASYPRIRRVYYLTSERLSENNGRTGPARLNPMASACRWVKYRIRERNGTRRREISNERRKLQERFRVMKFR